LYPHHHGVTDNALIDQYTFPIAADVLHDSGYYCGWIGKQGFIKDPGPSYDYWLQSSSNDYWNTFYYSNYNKGINHGNNRPFIIDGHKTNILTDTAIYFLQHRDKAKPFLLYVAHKAPHVPLYPRAEDSNLYKGEVMPVPPNFTNYTKN